MDEDFRTLKISRIKSEDGTERYLTTGFLKTFPTVAPP
jgi:hypothetical protein